MAHRFTHRRRRKKFQIIDPATCELRSHVSQLVSAASPDIAEQVKHELHQSIVETGTRICRKRQRAAHRNASHARRARRGRRTRGTSGGRGGDTTPFQAGSTRSSLPANAISTSSKKWVELARSLLIFGIARSRGHAGQTDDHRT